MAVSNWNYASVDLGESRNGDLFEASPTTSSSRTMHNPRLDELFNACDTKGRGVIGPVEFRELCDKFGISPTDSDVIFADLDHDGDGNIDFGDFSHGFRDFLTPGSRRGSLQVSPVADSSSNDQQLLEMEKKHASAKTAWKHFVTNVGTSNLQQFISHYKEQLSGIAEETRSDDGKGRNDIPPTLENALTSLIMDVQHLHDEYKTLECTFRKEREVHAAQLVALGEELDQQLAKAEAKAKAEARQEAQRQMDTERKKIASDIENQLADLSSQIKTFQKVEEWLAEEEERENKRVKAPEDQSKLHEAESENRNLRSALVEAQMKATLLQTQLTEKRNEYLDLFNALHSEKQAASEYKSQVNLMQNHLVVLSEANRVLSDANDCLSTQLPSNMSGFSPPSSLSISAQQEVATLASQSNHSCPNSLGILESLEPPPVKQSSSDPRIPLVPSLPFFETDRDSGRSTLLEELRAEGDGSPLPSGIWTCSSSSSPPPPPPPTSNNSLQQQDLLGGKRSGGVGGSDGGASGKWPTSQNGIGPGKLGSSCCSNERDERSGSGSSSPPQSSSRNRRHNPPPPAEATYKSFEYGEDGSQELYEALSPVAGGSSGGGHMGERLSQDYEEEERLPPHHHHESSASSSASAASFYPHRTFKVILAGDAAVGKTTFIERICHGHFTPNLSSTIGVDFRVKTIELDGKCVALQLWDTAGQERFRSLTKSYFRRADGVILMYDVSNERTFANIRNWINNVEEGAGRTVPIVLSGNKVDLREEGKWQRAQHHGMCVTQEDGEKLARQCGAIFVETSPKTGHNVFEALMMLAKEMSQVEDAELRNSLQLSENSEEKMKKKGCCGGGSSSPVRASGPDGDGRKGRTSPNGH